jgi:hypothetical protein
MHGGTAWLEASHVFASSIVQFANMISGAKNTDCKTAVGILLILQ